MTVKTGQKCTAVRRVLVPENSVDAVQEALISRLEKTAIGNPENKEVRMGALATKIQVERVKENVELLMQSQEMVYGSLEKIINRCQFEKGCFFPPILFRNEQPFLKDDVHHIEALTISTLIPYKDMEEAVSIVEMGKGSLVTSIVTNDDEIAKTFVTEAAHMNGRILVLNERCAKESTGHGSPMPLLTHGGPGRAGGGEEMGVNKRNKTLFATNSHTRSSRNHYKNYRTISSRRNQPISQPHVFRKHFEELVVGETVFTHKHTVSQADIVNFANVSGDNFYAHMDVRLLMEPFLKSVLLMDILFYLKRLGFLLIRQKGLFF